MHAKVKKDIQDYLSQHTFKASVESYKQGQEFDNLKAVCFKEDTYLESFMMGVVYSTCSGILNSSYLHGRPVLSSDVREMILLLRDWIESN